MPPAKSTPVRVLAAPDPLPSLLQRRAEAESNLCHTLMAGNDTAAIRGVLAATDAAIVTVKTDRARAEAAAAAAREQRIRGAASALVAEASARVAALTEPFRLTPVSDLQTSAT